MKLRPYQERAIADLRAAYASGKRAPVLVLPTGGGKTVIASAVVKGAIERGNKVLFLAHRSELLDQTLSKLEMNGITDTRLIRASTDLGSPTAAVTVASIQTLTRRVVLPKADLVVFDECHHVAAKTWRKIADYYSAARLLGMTATPQRADGKPLGDIFDSMVVGCTVQELTDLGYLVPCRVQAPAAKLETAELAVSPVDAYQRSGEGQRAVVFCVTVEHAELVQVAFREAGYATGLVHGELSAAERKQTLAAFRAGQLQVVCNVHVLTEGWDDPGCTVAILTKRPAHVGTFLQIVGRVLRPAPGKTHAILLDLCGSVHDHGTPNCARDFTLDGEGIAYDAEREPIRQCPTCGGVFRMADITDGACPVCAAMLPVKPIVLPKVIGVGIGEVGYVAPRAFTVAMTSKYPGVCRSCTGRIHVGERIFWAKGSKPRHANCGSNDALAEANRLLKAVN